MPVIPARSAEERTAARALQRRILRPDGPLPTDREPPADAVILWIAGVGATTVHPAPWPHAAPPVAPPVPDWQLRSLAVEPEHRGRGVGAQLIEAAVAGAVERGAQGLWAQARVRAVPLYLRCGWRAEGPEWDKPGVGPHRWVRVPG